MISVSQTIICRGVSWGGALGARAPRVTKGAPKKRKGKERERGEKREKREKEGNKKEKREERVSKKEKRKKVKSIWREGRHVVSSASRGSREENVRSAKLTEKRTRGVPCSFKCKQGLQERKRHGRQIDGEKDEIGAMQFPLQAGAPGKKTSGALNWRRKGREMRHAVSSASNGSREENVRGAKLTEKRTRGVPCSFKCKQGLQGRKRQGRQIDGEDKRAPCSFKCKQGLREENVRGAKLTEKRTTGVPCSFKCKQGLQGRKRQRREIDGEKENKSLNCQTYFPFDFKIRNVVFLNSIIMMLVSFTFLLYSTTPRQCRPRSYRGKKLVIPSWQMEKEVNTAPHHPHSPKGPGRPLATNWI